MLLCLGLNEVFEVELHDLVVFLIAAGLIVPAARRLRLNPILGYLAAGMAVGPFGLAQFAEQAPWLEAVAITNVSAASSLAELGVVFLLFMIALELPIARLLAMRRLVFGLGMLQVVVTTAAISGVAFGFGNSASSALLIGGALALSSTAIVSQHLLNQQQLGTDFGQISLGVLLAQDLAVVPMLFLLGTFDPTAASVAATEGVSSSGGLWASLGVAMLKAALAIALIVLIGRWLMRPLFRLVNVDHSSDVFMATTLLVIALTATLTHAAGLSAALGAFLAGLVLAETEFRHEIELVVEPLKGLLLGLFFMSVGMNINLLEVAENPGWILLSVVGLLIIKALIVTLLARLFGYSMSTSAQSGMTLAQGGEFAFVIVGGAVAIGLTDSAIGQFMLIVVSATMVLTPGLIKGAAALGRRLTPVAKEPEVGPPAAGHVILVGYGRTGQLLATLLNTQNRAWTGLDLNPVRVAEEQAKGAPLYLGDASRRGMLEKVNLAGAVAVVICTDDHRFSERILGAVRDLSAEVPVLMRVHSSQAGSAFIEAGATVAVPEVLESGLRLAASLFDLMGLAPESYKTDLDNLREIEGPRQRQF